MDPGVIPASGMKTVPLLSPRSLSRDAFRLDGLGRHVHFAMRFSQPPLCC
jgi:hypothetical protein